MSVTHSSPRPTPTDEAMSMSMHRALTEPATGRHRRLALAVEAERSIDIAGELRETLGRLTATMDHTGGMTALLLAGVCANLADVVDLLDPDHPVDLWPAAAPTAEAGL